MATEILPLFPLSSVLLPGGRLPLQIFEPRYVDMVRRCMREGSGFGVVLIRAGCEVYAAGSGDQPEISAIGTRAEIVDFNPLDNGLLGVVAAGRERIRVRRTDERPDHLLVGEVERLEELPPRPLPTAHAGLADLLGELLGHPAIDAKGVEVDWEDGGSVAWRLAELLPVEPEVRQRVLELEAPAQRLAELERIVVELRESVGH